MGLPNVCPMCKGTSVLEHQVGNKRFVAMRTYKPAGVTDEIREVTCADCGCVYAVDKDPTKMTVVELKHERHPLYEAIKAHNEEKARKEQEVR